MGGRRRAQVVYASAHLCTSLARACRGAARGELVEGERERGVHMQREIRAGSRSRAARGEGERK